MPESGPAGSALAEGLYWYAEKLMWGYEGVEKNHDEAFKLYRQAAELGFSDAAIRASHPIRDMRFVILV